MESTLPTLVIAVSVTTAISLLGDSMLYAVLPAMAGDLGIPIGLVGVLLSVNRWVRLLTNAAAAAAFRRWGARAGLIAGSALTIGSTVSYGAFPFFAAMLPARIAWGTAYSLLRLGAYGAVLHESTERNRGRLMGLYQSISRFGSMVAALVGGILAEAIGFRWAAIAFGLVGLLGLSLGAAAGRRLDASSAAPPPVARPTGPRRLRLPAWDAPLRVNLVALMSGFAGFGVVVSTVGLLLFQTFGRDVQVGGVAVGVVAVSGALVAVRFGSDIVLSPLFGHLSDRRGRWIVVMAGSACVVAGLVLLASSRALVTIVGGSVAVFLASSAVQVTLEAWAADLARERDWTSVMSRFATFRDVGSAAGPLLALPLAGAVGLHWVYLGVAVALAAALAVLPRPSGLRPSDARTETAR